MNKHPVPAADRAAYSNQPTQTRTRQHLQSSCTPPQRPGKRLWAAILWLQALHGQCFCVCAAHTGFFTASFDGSEHVCAKKEKFVHHR